MEPAEPPFPSLFLNLPPTTPQAQGGDVQSDALQVLSSLLMEDTSMDKLSYQYPDDHPGLIQAQQTYAQIISDTWTHKDSLKLSPLQMTAVAPCYYNSGNIDTLASIMLSPGTQGNNSDGTFFFSSGTEEMTTHKVEPNSMGVVSMEAINFLPGGGRAWKKRLNSENKEEAEVDVGRSSKQMAVPPLTESEKEIAARKMLEKLMLNDGCDASCLTINGMRDEPRIGVEMEKQHERRHAVDMHTMLIRCAEAVATNDRHRAVELLQRIRHLSSPTGDGTQRLAHYFADGLEARLHGTGNQLYRSLKAKRATATGILKAYQVYKMGIGFFTMKFFFSNQIIYKAIAGRKKLHVVQHGLACWFQWPELLRQLACRKGGPPEVRLTGIDTPQPGFRPAHVVEETGRWLSDCARQFGVPFKFYSIVAKSEDVNAKDMGIDPSEVLVVNNLFYFDTLLDENVFIDRPNPKDKVLNTIRKMRPKVFIHAAVNAPSSASYFVTRFREAVFHFSTLFDMTDTIMPRDSYERLALERGAFARAATNIIACEGADRVERPQSYKSWEARIQRAGLRQLPLDPDIVQRLKDRSKECDMHFLIDKDDQWLLSGWKGRVLFTMSTWTADD
ncbi:hypothetical protein ACP4OV_002146 [Aristida adscensionis]